MNCLDTGKTLLFYYYKFFKEIDLLFCFYHFNKFILYFVP